MKAESCINAYDPTDEAVALLEKHPALTVVKGLLNQLGACRQTRKINSEWDVEKLDMLEKCFDIAEKAKQVLREKGYGWTGLDILETCKLVPDNDSECKQNIKSNLLNSSGKNHLEWIYYRMVFEFKEKPTLDYMIKFRSIIESINKL